MKNTISKKILLSFILINLIPVIMSIIHFELDYEGNYESINNVLYSYNSINGGLLGLLLLNNKLNFLLTIMIFIYNGFLIILLHNISKFTKKHIILITTIFSIFSAIFWVLYHGIQLSI